MTTQNREELADTLIAISVISKRIARKLQEEKQHEQNEEHQPTH